MDARAHGAKVDAPIRVKPVDVGPQNEEKIPPGGGWSGTGFKQAPAVGAQVVRWVSEGAPKRPELVSYTLTRFEEGAPIRGGHEYAAPL